MFKEIKRFSIQSVIYGVGHFLVRGAQFIVTPIHTNFMPIEEYGVAQVILTWVACANVIYLFGMDVAFLRFFIIEKDNERKRAIFTTCWLLVLGAGSIFSFFVFYYSAYFSLLIFQSSQYAGLLKYTSGILWLDALAVLPFLILRAREQAKLFTILKLGGVIINLIMNVVYVVFLKKGAEGILLSFIWSSAFSLIVISPLIYRHFRLLFDGDALKEILNFGLPYIIPGLSIWAMDLIDRQIIQYYLGEGATGVYGANYKFAMAMALFVAAFRFAWHPFFLSISDQPDAKIIYARILTYFIGFSGWFFLALSFFIKDIITFPIGSGSLLGPDYWGGLDIIPLVILGYVFYGIHVNCVVSIYLTKKSYYLSINTALAAILNILLNIYFVPVYGIMASAFSTAIAYLFMAVLQYFISQRLYPIPYETGRIFKLIFINTVLFSAGYWNLVPYQISVKIVLIILYPLILKKMGFFNREELDRLKNMWQSRRRKRDIADAAE